jgi:hypothetical protein
MKMRQKPHSSDDAPLSGLGLPPQSGLANFPINLEGKARKGIEQKEAKEAKTEGCVCWAEGAVGSVRR